MKRLFAVSALAVATWAPATAAHADHLCVTSSGRPVYCAPHPIITIDQICVTSGGSPLICVP